MENKRIVKIVYEYDDRRNYKTINEFINDKLKCKTICNYKYNDTNLEEMVIDTIMDIRETAKSISKYDKENRIVSMSIFDCTGDILDYEIKYSYNENKITMKDTNGTETEIEKDEYGNVIKQTQYISCSNEKNILNFKHVYDKNNNKVCVITTGEDETDIQEIDNIIQMINYNLLQHIS